MGTRDMKTKSSLKTWLGLAYVVIGLIMFASAAFSQGIIPDQPVVPLGYQQITSSAAMSLTVPTGATIAVITVSGNTVKYRDDGTVPTASLGVTLPVTTAGLPFGYHGTLSKIQFFPTTGSATLDILYYR
jgi:hypothetical protein